MQEQDIKTVQQDFSGVASRKLNDLLYDGYEISGVSLYHPSKHQYCFCTQAGFIGWFRGEHNIGEVNQDWYLNAMSFITKHLQDKYSIDNSTAKAIARQIAEFGEDYKGIK